MPFHSDAQITMRDALLSMPDSLIPYLSHSGRLDLLDYLDANMKPEATNDLGGKSELLLLTNDSLSLRMNDSHRIDAFLLPTEEMVDSASQIIVLGHTYFLSTGEYERTYQLYSVRWRRLERIPQLSQQAARRIDGFPSSTLFKRDEEIFRKEPVL
jgi:hypothetical protein